MRVNKISVYITAPITILSLAAAIVLHNLDFEFATNILIGIFASGLLAFILAIIGYFVERRKVLERFYTYVQKSASNFNRFENNGDLEQSISSILFMNQIDYVELDNAYGDIAFLFFNKKNKSYIYDRLYHPITTARNLIAEKCFHFREYRNAIEGNKRVMHILVQDVAEVLLSTTTKKGFTGMGMSMVMNFTYNKLAENLRNELNGKFYKLMYPFKHKEVSNHAD